MSILIDEKSASKVYFRWKGDTVAGYLLLEKYTWLSLNGWNIEIINVFPQRKGIGTKLLYTALEWLKDKGIKSVTVNPITTESINFFKKHNFSLLPNYKNIWIFNL